MLKRNLPCYFKNSAFVLFILFSISNAFTQTSDQQAIIKNFYASPQVISSYKDTLKAIFDFESNYSGTNLIQFYISNDTILEKFGPFEDYNIGGESITQSHNSKIIIPAGVYRLKPGKYFLFIDYSSSSKTRSVYAPFEILKAEPEIIVKSITKDTLELSPGIASNVKYNYGRKGYINNDSNNIFYYLSKDTLLNINSDIQVGYNKNNFSLYYDYSENVQDSIYIPANIPLGKYYLLFAADPKNYFTEENETNNVSWQPANLKLLNIDYAVISGKVSFNYADNSISSEQEIKNLGTTKNVYSRTGFYLSTDTILDKKRDRFMGESILSPPANNPLYRNANYYKLPVDLNSGTYYVIFAADYRNEINEENEKNNIYFQKLVIQLTRQPDFVIIPEGDSIITTSSGSNTFSIKVKNIGTAKSGASTVVFFAKFIDGSLTPNYGNYTSKSLPPLDSGEEYELQFDAKINTEDIYYVNYEVDPLNAISEIEETNNTYRQKVIFQKITEVFTEKTKVLLEVSPNPAQDFFSINAEDNISYTLCDSFGKEVWNGIGKGSIIRVQTSAFAKGLYILIATKNGNTQQKKIVLY